MGFVQIRDEREREREREREKGWAVNSKFGELNIY